jgi:hypothetical protein
MGLMRRRRCGDDERPLVNAPTATCESDSTNNRRPMDDGVERAQRSAVLMDRTSSELMCSSWYHGAATIVVHRAVSKGVSMACVVDGDVCGDVVGDA